MTACGSEWSEFRTCLVRRTGFDLDDYKPTPMRRRVTEFMEGRGHSSHRELWTYLEESPGHLRAFIDRLAINVSEMFRNPEKWAELPVAIRGNAAVGPLRVWSAGCSHGAEAYSVAMTLMEYFPGEHSILGTDIDQAALKRARRACYSDSESQSVPECYRKRFLETTGAGWSVRADMRSLVHFRHQNLLGDVPNGQFDLILCRNVSIYFTEAAKERLTAALARALVPGGVLFVGTSERCEAIRWFEPILPGFYRRTDAP